MGLDPRFLLLFLNLRALQVPGKHLVHENYEPAKKVIWVEAVKLDPLFDQLGDFQDRQADIIHRIETKKDRQKGDNPRVGAANKKSFLGEEVEAEAEEAERGMILIDDMWLDRDQLDGGKKEGGGINIKERLWPDRTLVYKFSKNFKGRQERKIRGALDDLKEKLEPCITFEELNDYSDYKPFVLVKPTSRHVTKCSAYTGFKNRLQFIKIARPCSSGTIQHEFLHALGVFHTHMRKDRDNYVTIIKKNIKRGRRNNFRMLKSVPTSNYSLRYDYDSIMHYSGKAYSRHPNSTDDAKRLTIRTKKKKNQDKIGQRKHLSRKDVELIKRMYKCK